MPLSVFHSHERKAHLQRRMEKQTWEGCGPCQDDAQADCLYLGWLSLLGWDCHLQEPLSTPSLERTRILFEARFHPKGEHSS